MGPMTFRFALQPAMAALEAGLDGARDARTGRSLFLWTLLTKSQERVCRLHEALRATARVMLLGLTMDIIYQYLMFDTFHPAEAVLIALLLAFMPYVILRGPAARIAKWYLARQGQGGPP